MTIERWGCLSVNDHIKPEILLPNLLLFDRLVMPSPVGEVEQAFWEEEEWEPRLLRERIDLLGPSLVVERPWTDDRRDDFHKRLHGLDEIEFDARNLMAEARKEVPYQMTRQILSMEPIKDLPDHVTHAHAVPTYPSRVAFDADFLIASASRRHPSPPPTDEAELGLLFAQKLALPEVLDEEVLKRAVDLARDSTFRQKRQALHRWQVEVLQSGVPPRAAVEEMSQLVDRYNASVKEALGKVYIRYACTVAGISLGFAGAGLGNPLMASSALLSMVQFSALFRKPSPQPGEARPAAVFHDIEKKLGISFR